MTGKKIQLNRVSEPAPSSGLGSYPIVEVKAGVFKDTCLQLLDQVQGHEMELVITKHGSPVARVIPPDVATPSAFGFMRGTVLGHEDIVSPDFESWGDLG